MRGEGGEEGGGTSEVGPTMERRTGRKMRPLRRPMMIRAVITMKKYLEGEGGA